MLLLMNTPLILKGTTVFALAVFAIQTASAQAPSGSITNLINNSSNTVWDAGVVQPLQNIFLDMTSRNDEVTVSYANAFTQDGKGKLSGNGSAEVSITSAANSNNDTNFNGNYVVRGSIHGNKGVANLIFSSKVTGMAFLQGHHQDKERAVQASVAYAVLIMSSSGTIKGRAAEHASAQGLGGIGGTRTFTNTIPSELGDGSWTLVMNFGTNLNNKLSGSATVTLNTGAMYDFQLTGLFNSSKNTSVLLLKGVDTGLGSVLTVNLSGDVVTRIFGKIAGQVVNQRF